MSRGPGVKTLKRQGRPSWKKKAHGRDLPAAAGAEFRRGRGPGKIKAKANSKTPDYKASRPLQGQEQDNQKREGSFGPLRGPQDDELLFVSAELLFIAACSSGFFIEELRTATYFFAKNSLHGGRSDDGEAARLAVEALDLDFFE